MDCLAGRREWRDRRIRRGSWKSRASSDDPIDPWWAKEKSRWAIRPGRPAESWGTRCHPEPGRSMTDRRRRKWLWTWFEKKQKYFSLIRCWIKIKTNQIKVMMVVFLAILGVRSKSKTPKLCCGGSLSCFASTRSTPLPSSSSRVSSCQIKFDYPDRNQQLIFPISHFKFVEIVGRKLALVYAGHFADLKFCLLHPVLWQEPARWFRQYPR